MSPVFFIITQNQSNRVHKGNFDITSPKKCQSCVQCWKGYDDNFFMRGFSVSACCISKSHCYSSELPRILAKNDRSFFKKNGLIKMLTKFFCIATMLSHMLRTSSPNFWKNKASKLFHILLIVQTLHRVTSSYSQKLKKPYVG